MKYRFYASGYADPREEGLGLFELDTLQGFRRVAAWRGLANPSYLLLHPRLSMLYAVEELTPEGRVRAWAAGEAPEQAACLPSRGADPCHLALSEDGRALFAANYTSGSLTGWRLDENGAPAGLYDHIQYEGHGPNPARQEGPHIHFALAQAGRLYVSDLGQDRIHVYDILPEGLRPLAPIRLHAGCGPRHLAAHPAHPGFLYCVTELGNTVILLRQDEAGNFAPADSFSTLPEGCGGPSAAAAIHFTADGRFLLASNRGHDSLAVFPVRPDGGLDAPVISPCVAQPRDFMICGEYVVVGSQRDSLIRAYRLEDDGRLRDTGWAVGAPKPVCFVSAGTAL